MKARWVIGIQAGIIVVLVVFLFHQYHASEQQNSQVINKTGLLSPRVYSGILPAKSYLILNFVPLKKELEQHIQKNNLSMSVYIVNLRDGASLSIGSRRAFRPASLSKVAIAILMMRKVEEQELSLNTPLEILNEDRIEGSGTLYLSNETKIPVKVLLQSMLEESDNTALKIFLRYLGQDEKKILEDYWDFFSSDTTSATEQGAGLITTHSMYNVFQSLYLSTILEPEHSEYILNLLANTVFDMNKIAQLPEDVRVAHKYAVGEYQDMNVFHDCGIMYLQEMRLFYCVITTGLEQKDGLSEIGYVVHQIYEYQIMTRQKLDQFQKKEVQN